MTQNSHLRETNRSTQNDVTSRTHTQHDGAHSKINKYKAEAFFEYWRHTCTTSDTTPKWTGEGKKNLTDSLTLPLSHRKGVRRDLTLSLSKNIALVMV